MDSLPTRPKQQPTEVTLPKCVHSCEATQILGTASQELVAEHRATARRQRHWAKFLQGKVKQSKLHEADNHTDRHDGRERMKPIPPKDVQHARSRRTPNRHQSRQQQRNRTVWWYA